MKAQDLKNSVLQLAIQGKLVEQNSNDEPASVLLEKIKAEKEKLIKEKKIKREKPLPEITEEEKLFEIPDSWEWIRLGNLIHYRMGKTPPRKEEVYWENGGYPWVSIADMISDGKVVKTKEFVNEFSYNNVFKGNISKKGTLIMSFKLTVGRVSILDIDAFHNEAIISIYPFVEDDDIIKQYLFKVLPKLTEYGNTKGAIKGNTLNSTSINNLLIPLPPLEEQKRIVAKIEEVLEKIEEYDKAEKELSAIEKAFPQDIKKSILHHAIQGKLVEQNQNDEPASVLLEKIKAEKEKLIQEKRIKREEPLPEISEEEKLFEIPDNWEWVRLGELSDIHSGNSINKDIKEKKYMGTKEGYPYIATKDVNSNLKIIDYNNGVRIPYTEEKFRVAKSKSILICAEGGSAGKKIGLLTKDVCFGNKLINFNGFIQEINKYIYYLFQSVEFYKQFVAGMTGIIGGISINKFKNIPIPLPPLEEQKRIVAKIEDVLEKTEEYVYLFN